MIIPNCSTPDIGVASYHTVVQKMAPPPPSREWLSQYCTPLPLSKEIKPLGLKADKLPLLKGGFDLECQMTIIKLSNDLFRNARVLTNEESVALHEAFLQQGKKRSSRPNRFKK